MKLMPIASHIYRDIIIGRNCNIAGLKWQAYCNGMFIYADTLAGMKQLIRESLKDE